MKQKKDDEIMAEYLLKGGKMLEKTCRQCGCPQFEYKGATLCVVCAEREQERKAAGSPTEGRRGHGTQKSSAVPGSAGTTGLKGPDSDICTGLSVIILDLCSRIKEEGDPDRCLVLMDAIKIGAEALQILRQQ